MAGCKGSKEKKNLCPVMGHFTFNVKHAGRLKVDGLFFELRSFHIFPSHMDSKWQHPSQGIVLSLLVVSYMLHTSPNWSGMMYRSRSPAVCLLLEHSLEDSAAKVFASVVGLDYEHQ